MSLHIDGAQRTGGTKVLAGSATDTTFFIYDGDLERVFVVGVGGHHLDGSGRAVAGTVAARHAVGQRYTVLLYPYGMSYLYRRFLFLCHAADGAGGAYLRATCTFRSAISPFVRHLRLHQLCPIG